MLCLVTPSLRRSSHGAKSWACCLVFLSGTHQYFSEGHGALRPVSRILEREAASKGDALAKTRKRCSRFEAVLEMAINCTRVLHVLGSHPSCGVMPMDLATCLSLRQPQRPLTSMLRAATQRLSGTTSYTLRHPAPPSAPAGFSSPSEPRSCFRRDNWGLKKRVSFADAKGLALTAIRLFIPEAASSSPCHKTLPSLVMRRFQTKQEEEAPGTRKPPYKLHLAFTQPSLDFKVFMSRQKEVGLQLESCCVTEYCLSGRVRVSQVGLEQTVYLRISFDSWRSHHDIPCTFRHTQRHGAIETEIHTFELSLPMTLDPMHGIEFGVSCRTDEGALWDDNRGQNFRIQVETDYTEHADVDQGSQKMPRFRSLPTLANNMTPVDVRSYAELSHLRELWYRGAEWGMCIVK